MQEKLLEAFYEAYYEEYNVPDRHSLFADILEGYFDTDITTEQAKAIAETIAAEGVLVCHNHDGIKEIIG